MGQLDLISILDSVLTIQLEYYDLPVHKSMHIVAKNLNTSFYAKITHWGSINKCYKSSRFALPSL